MQTRDKHHHHHHRKAKMHATPKTPKRHGERQQEGRDGNGHGGGNRDSFFVDLEPEPWGHYQPRVQHQQPPTAHQHRSPPNNSPQRNIRRQASQRPCPYFPPAELLVPAPPSPGLPLSSSEVHNHREQSRFLGPAATRLGSSNTVTPEPSDFEPAYIPQPHATRTHPRPRPRPRSSLPPSPSLLSPASSIPLDPSMHAVTSPSQTGLGKHTRWVDNPNCIPPSPPPRSPSLPAVTTEEEASAEATASTGASNNANGRELRDAPTMILIAPKGDGTPGTHQRWIRGVRVPYMGEGDRFFELAEKAKRDRLNGRGRESVGGEEIVVASDPTGKIRMVLDVDV